MEQVTVVTTLQEKRSKKNSTRKIKPTKKVLLTVTDHAPDVICRFNKEYRLLYVNPAIELATGIPPHQFINKSTRELGMPEVHSKDWEDGVDFVYTYGTRTTIEFPFLTPTGIRHFQSLLVPEFNTSGEVETVLSISRDITDIKESTKKKDEIVGFVSHELKTPVTALKVFTQTLQQRFEKSGDLRSAGHLAKMDTQLNRLTDIINDLTEATRIENDTLSLKKDTFDFDDLVEDIVSEVKETGNGHTFTLKGKAKKKVTADKTRIGQVLTNLLSNAIKYSPPISEVLIEVSSDKQNVFCSVQDKGIGIPKEQQEKVFHRFYRVDEAQHKDTLGLGLGLYITAEIIKKHKGRIWIDSEVGNGSRFSFSIPCN